MPRNMIKANQNVFSQIIEYLESKEYSTLQERRYIKTSDREKEWLQQLNINKKLTIHPHLSTATFEFEADTYLLIVGQEFNIVFDEVFENVDINAGIFTALVSELSIGVHIHADAAEIFNNIMFQHTETGYAGHDYLELITYFEPITVFKILEDAPLTVDALTRLSGYLLSKNINSLSLPFSPATILKYEKTFLEGSNNIPFENVLVSLVSVQWKFAFLDLYRCLERLYSVIPLDDLHQSLGLGIVLLDFSARIEEKLGWRPKEEDALGKLLIDVPPDILDYFEIVKAKYGHSETKIHTWIYILRNSIVHFRPATQSISLSDDDWDIIIQGCLLLVGFWYKKLETKIL